MSKPTSKKTVRVPKTRPYPVRQEQLILPTDKPRRWLLTGAGEG